MQQPGQVEVKLSQDLRTESSGNDPAKVGWYPELAKLPSLLERGSVLEKGSVAHSVIEGIKTLSWRSLFMSEANVLDKYHAPTDGRHFFGTKNVDCPMLQI